jgi:hypothetical protein
MDFLDLFAISYTFLSMSAIVSFLIIFVIPLFSFAEFQKVIDFGNIWLKKHRSHSKFQSDPHHPKTPNISIEERKTYDDCSSCWPSGSIQVVLYPTNFYPSPDCRYARGLIVLAHELGHCQLLVGYGLSSTGENYLNRKKSIHQLHSMIRKEELLAWIEGFKWLWRFPIISWKKIILIFAALIISLDCFLSYCLPTDLIMEEEKTDA